MNSVKILVGSLDHYYPGARTSEQEDAKSGEETPETLSRRELVDDAPAEDYSIYTISEDNPELDEAPETKPPKEDTKPGRRSILYVVPHMLVVNPLVFMWWIVSFPFGYLYDWLVPPKLEVDKQTLDEKTALLKHENIISNSIKSPTSSSKYIIPPPQRLFPLSRNPGKKKKRKTLILDLDETLIHSLSRGTPRSFLGSSSLVHMIEVKINNVATLYYVHKRPYCDHFLREIAKWYELQIFTASVREYADPIIDWLEGDISARINPHDPQSTPQKVFTRRYYRQDCTYRPGVGYIKDLSKFFTKEDDLKSVVILDNSPVSYALHEDNAVMIEGWINDHRDRDLLNLLPVLRSLSVSIDVRFILGMRSGEKLFES